MVSGYQSSAKDNTQRIDGATTGQDTIVISTSAYAAGDSLGGLIEFQIPSAGGGGRLTDFYLEDEHEQDAAITLYFFDKKPTVIADNAPVLSGLSLADKKALIKIETLGSYVDLSGVKKAFNHDIDQDFKSSDNILYMYAVIGEIKTYNATTDITMSIIALLN
jgi:hypothetical protein